MEADTAQALEEEEDVRWAISSGPTSPAARNARYTEESPLLSGDAVAPTDTIDGDGEGDTAHHAPWLGSKEASSKPWYKRPSIFWILPPILPFTIAFGGVAVPKINLILALICRDYLSDRATRDPTFTYLPVIFGEENPQCRLPEVQALVSRFQLLVNLISGILSAVASPKLGLLSDGYGRNRILALCATGTLLGEVVTVIVAARSDIFSVNYLLLGSVLDGMFGSVTTALALTQSYAADCTPPARRNVAFGYFHGVLFSGIAVGPILAGYLIKYTGNILVVFYAVIGCHLFFVLFLGLAVPESVSKERQEHNRATREIRPLDVTKVSLSSWRGLNPLSLLKPLSILFPPSRDSGLAHPTEKRRMRDLRVNLMVLSAIDSAIFGVAMGTMSILVIYAEYMFGWGNFESSIFVSLTASVRVIVLLVILPTITRIVRGPQRYGDRVNTGCDALDITVIKISTIFDLIGYVGYALARSGPLLMLSGGLAAVGAMASPTLQSSLTKHVPPALTGQLMGAVGLLHALARVVAPTVFNLIYSATVGNLPQTVFICLSCLLFVGFVASWFVTPHVYMNDTAAPANEDTRGENFAEDGIQAT